MGVYTGSITSENGFFSKSSPCFWAVWQVSFGGALSAGRTVARIWKYIQESNKHKCGNGGRHSEAGVISGTEEKGEIP